MVQHPGEKRSIKKNPLKDGETGRAG